MLALIVYRRPDQTYWNNELSNHQLTQTLFDNLTPKMSSLSFKPSNIFMQYFYHFKVYLIQYTQPNLQRNIQLLWLFTIKLMSGKRYFICIHMKYDPVVPLKKIKLTSLWQHDGEYTLFKCIIKCFDDIQFCFRDVRVEKLKKSLKLVSSDDNL